MADPIQLPPIDVRISISLVPEWAPVFQALIEGQTPEQRSKLWQQWIDFWAPWNKLSNQISTNVAEQITKLLKV